MKQATRQIRMNKTGSFQDCIYKSALDDFTAPERRIFH